MTDNHDIYAPRWLSEDRQLLIGKAQASGRTFYPPRPLAPGTLEQAETFPSAGVGSLYAFSHVLRGGPEPYVLAMVTLDEGPTLLTHMVDCDPGALSIGARVRMVVRNLAGSPAPVFRLDE